ncbi:MAG: hypothetical protein K0R72_1022 [Clostridia bacterium]|jgi:hypothetical protein|nr:hypothetical protein [Clostridia bacterium]
MKKQIIQDERVVAQKQKILSESYVILMIILIISIFIQQNLLNAPFKQYAVEFICFFGISIYILIRNLTLGIDMFGEKKKAKIIALRNSIIAGIAVTVVTGISNYIEYAEKYEGKLIFFVISLLITFVSAVICTFVVFALIGFINNMKINQLEKKLDEEEKRN